ncbi:MAG: hypothetical protein M1816_003123 [Peltula sp. TS41687]|nr:MAG: hypothetical protein M1816_003123 [Peltula sp. TS41687]
MPNETPAHHVDSLKLTNQVHKSRSPFLRGHKDNPVAWQEWNEESLQLAKKHNRLIFLSIGYSACHWCHVMERESFESEEVARILNESFIPIKVDREERPDVDRIYMNYVQATTGSGGWPLNVFLTPDLAPIFGGTYWPGPNSNIPVMLRGQAGFLDILKRVRRVWQHQQDRCRNNAKAIMAQLRAFTQEGSHPSHGDAQDGEGLEIDILEEAYQHFTKRYDPINGGFGGAPKFPTPVNLSFLLRLGAFPAAVRDVVGEADCKKAASIAIDTLRHMARGGIHDHIGPGFARYSVTADWSLPHFEKMLYDNAQLLDVYLDAFLVSEDPEMLGCVYDIADYLTADALAAPEGGFHSSEDADSLYRSTETEKREGAFYVWTRKEFDTLLSEQEAEICARFWNVQRHGNVARKDDAMDEFTNQNVLAVHKTPSQLAREFGLSEEVVVGIIKEGKRKLWEHREMERPRAALDGKIVTCWNGLAIGSLARTSVSLEPIDPEHAQAYLKHAVRAANFIRENMYDEATGKLKRLYFKGSGHVSGFADDYAFLIQGLIHLYEATFDESYLQWADSLQKTQISLFWDESSSGFFATETGAQDLILRLKDGMDNAEPSPNGISAQNLYRLSSMFGDDEYGEYARKTCRAFEPELMQHPFLFTSMLPAVVAGALGVKSVVVTGQGPRIDEALKRIRGRIRSAETLVRLVPETAGGWLTTRNARLAEIKADKPSVMVCEEESAERSWMTFWA